MTNHEHRRVAVPQDMGLSALYLDCSHSLSSFRLNFPGFHVLKMSEQQSQPQLHSKFEVWII